MKNLLLNTFGTLLALLLIAFGLLNRDAIDVYFSPLSPPLPIPLYAVVLGMFVGGFVVGGFVVWMNTAGDRRMGRKTLKKVMALEQQLGTIKSRAVTPVSPASEFFPSLPHKQKPSS